MLLRKRDAIFITYHNWSFNPSCPSTTNNNYVNHEGDQDDDDDDDVDDDGYDDDDDDNGTQVESFMVAKRLIWMRKNS